jgi:hypothetical protein
MPYFIEKNLNLFVSHAVTVFQRGTLSATATQNKNLSTMD